MKMKKERMKMSRRFKEKKLSLETNMKKNQADGQAGKCVRKPTKTGNIFTNIRPSRLECLQLILSYGA